MDSAHIHTYCLFCVSGQESKVIKHLEKKTFVPLAPQVVRWQPGICGAQKKSVRLLPGYIFFDGDADAKPDWQELRRIPSVLRILKYHNDEYALRGTDLLFVDWLKRFNGVIEISSVIQVGTKIRIVDGPLKEMSGRIIKVNKNRKVVQVSFEQEEGLLQSVWCGIDYVQINEDEKVVLNTVQAEAGASDVTSGKD